MTPRRRRPALDTIRSDAVCCRVSTDDQARGAALDNQLAQYREFAAGRG